MCIDTMGIRCWPGGTSSVDFFFQVREKYYLSIGVLLD